MLLRPFKSAASLLAPIQRIIISRKRFFSTTRTASSSSTTTKATTLSSLAPWTLRQLADLSEVRDEPSTAQLILQQVADRLQRQHERLMHLQHHQHQQQLTSKSNNSSHNSNLDHLLYLHQDTFQLTQQVQQAGTVFERWSPADQALVKSTLQQVRDRHAISLERCVDLMVAMDDNTTTTTTAYQEINDDDSSFCNRDQAFQTILQARMGILLLCDHYVKLQQQTVGKQRPGVVGAISVDCNVVSDILPDVVAETSHICEAHWMVAPVVQILQQQQEEEDAAASVADASDDKTTNVTVVGSWVHATLVEVLKNAMQATLLQQQQQQANTSGDTDFGNNMPPIVIRVTKYNDSSNSSGNWMLQLDVIDQGTGLSDTNNPELLFQWGRPRQEQRWDRLQDQQSYAAVRSPLTGLGVGLAHSRCMLRHFGGNVQLLSSSSSSLRDEEQKKKMGCTARITLPMDDDIPECTI